MKTFKQFNEEAHYHLHEIDRVGFAIPFAGPIMKGLSYVNKAANPIYRAYGAYDTSKKVYKSIKDKKGPAHTALSALSGLQYAAPLNKGKNFVRQLGNFVKSKRFLGGVGAETAAELIDDAQKNKKNSQNTVNSKPKETKTKKFNYDTDFINNKKK